MLGGWYPPQAEEDLLVQTLVTKLAVERLRVAVLPWTARLDVERSGTEPGQPATDHLSGHLRSVVRTNVLRNAADEHNVGQCFDDAKTVDATGNPDGQAFAGILIDQVMSLMRRPSWVWASTKS